MEPQKINQIIQILISCQPENCQLDACPLYYKEMQKCDAVRNINLLTTIAKHKFGTSNTYDFSKDFIIKLDKEL